MRCGLKKDDEILLFDGEKAQDMLDAAYFDSQSSFTVTVLRSGKTVTLQVDKPSEIPMGWDFYDECFIRPRWCANKCIFCFVDQLPKGQRETLYVKDDDWRLSFVSGNFVTLTNVSDSDVKRIVDKKFSPLSGHNAVAQNLCAGGHIHVYAGCHVPRHKRRGAP